LEQQLSTIESSISSIERTTDTQTNIIIDIYDNEGHVQKVKQKIPEILQKIAALRNLNLEDAVNKAKQAVERSGGSSLADGKLPVEATPSDRKKTNVDKTAETSNMEDDFDYSGLFKQ
ncbi:unnamed protein product, partial [Candidula unifasciata]